MSDQNPTIDHDPFGIQSMADFIHDLPPGWKAIGLVAIAGLSYGIGNLPNWNGVPQPGAKWDESQFSPDSARQHQLERDRILRDQSDGSSVDIANSPTPSPTQTKEIKPSPTFTKIPSKILSPTPTRKASIPPPPTARPQQGRR